MLKKKFLFFLIGISSFAFLHCQNIAVAQNESTVEAQQEQNIRDKENDSSRVDINSATLDELISLKGVGKKRAEAIVKEREQNGKFESIDALTRVKGFSQKIIARIKTQNSGKIQAR